MNHQSGLWNGCNDRLQSSTCRTDIDIWNYRQRDYFSWWDH